MKNLITIALASLFLTFFFKSADAQKVVTKTPIITHPTPTPPIVPGDIVIDIASQLKAVTDDPLKTGLIEVKTLASGYKVYINKTSATTGKLVVKDKNGDSVPTVSKVKQGGNQVKCWESFTDSNGNVNWVHVDCPTIDHSKDRQ